MRAQVSPLMSREHSTIIPAKQISMASELLIQARATSIAACRATISWRFLVFCGQCRLIWLSVRTSFCIVRILLVIYATSFD
ncbi:hypothetical protein BJX64DRAFT_264967 [Aspergillus heterothallicus]